MVDDFDFSSKPIIKCSIGLPCIDADEVAVDRVLLPVEECVGAAVGKWQTAVSERLSDIQLIAQLASLARRGGHTGHGRFIYSGGD